MAARAVALRIAASPAFAERQRRPPGGSRGGERCSAAGSTTNTSGTDVHLVAADLREAGLGNRPRTGASGSGSR
ncbi:hypothetical protein HBB16_09085 [Pseudonocardia sp. MCCB 268]|nr:hypothetical protein [Pseudonocardia cytotoxica]